MSNCNGFFLLPRELRDRVYTYYLLVDGGYVCDTDELIQGRHHRCLKQADGQPLKLSLAYTCKTVAAEMRPLTLGTNTITFSTFFSDDLCFLAGTFSKMRADFLDNLRNTIFHFSGDSMIGQVYSELAAIYPQFVPVLEHVKKVTNRKDPHHIPDNYGEALSSYREFVKHALQLASAHYEGEFVRGANRLWRRLGIRSDDIRRIDPLRIVHCSIQPWDIPSYGNVMELASYFNPSRRAKQLARFLGDSSETKILSQLRQGDRSKYRLSAAASAIRFLGSLDEEERKSIRRIVLNEDKESVADPASHARGLISFCQENPLLRVERRVNLWRNVFQPHHGAQDPHSRVTTFCGSTSVDFQLRSGQITWNVAIWVMEALALQSAGIPLASFSLVMNGDPAVRQCEVIFQGVVQRDLALQLARDRACRQGGPAPLSWIEKRGPNPSRTFASFGSQFFQGYTFEDFPKAMESVSGDNSIVRFNFNIGVPWNVEKIAEENQSFDLFDWDWYWMTRYSSETVAPLTGWKDILLESVIPKDDFKSRGPEMFKIEHRDSAR